MVAGFVLGKVEHRARDTRSSACLIIVHGRETNSGIHGEGSTCERTTWKEESRLDSVCGKNLEAYIFPCVHKIMEDCKTNFEAQDDGASTQNNMDFVTETELLSWKSLMQHFNRFEDQIVGWNFE